MNPVRGNYFRRCTSSALTRLSSSSISTMRACADTDCMIVLASFGVIRPCDNAARTVLPCSVSEPQSSPIFTGLSTLPSRG
jgi:hypothetical protein